MATLIRYEDALAAIWNGNTIPIADREKQKNMLEQLVSENPVQAMPLVRAEWIDIENKHDPEKPFVSYGPGYGMCSACHAVEWIYRGKVFCPYCAARMD